jgi:RimJ/RimL family protein N-acetyltransferase
LKHPFLVGELVYLRPLQADDAELFAEWLNDTRVTRTLRARGPITVEAEREWIARVSADPSEFVCALVLRKGDRLIGSAGLHAIDWQARSASFGIKIGIPAMWGRGYGTEATRLVTDHAFRTLNLNRVGLQVHAGNVAGRRAYEKAGYRVEGIQREAVYREGRFGDLVLMAVLRSQWEAAAGADGKPRAAARAGPAARRGGGTAGAKGRRKR